MLEIILAIIAIVSGPVGSWITSRLLRQKYAAEVEKLRAEADTIKAKIREHQIDIDRKAIQMIMELVVEPLRRDMLALQNEVETLTNAIKKINTCPHADDCPVSHELRRAQRSGNAEPLRKDGRHPPAAAGYSPP